MEVIKHGMITGASTPLMLVLLLGFILRGFSIKKRLFLQTTGPANWSMHFAIVRALGTEAMVRLQEVVVVAVKQ